MSDWHEGFTWLRPDGIRLTPAVKAEVLHRLDVDATDGRPVWGRVEGDQLHVTDPAGARWSLQGALDILRDNADSPGLPAPERTRARMRARGLEALLDKLGAGQGPETESEKPTNQGSGKMNKNTMKETLDRVLDTLEALANKARPKAAERNAALEVVTEAREALDKAPTSGGGGAGARKRLSVLVTGSGGVRLKTVSSKGLVSAKDAKKMGVPREVQIWWDAPGSGRPEATAAIEQLDPEAKLFRRVDGEVVEVTDEAERAAAVPSVAMEAAKAAAVEAARGAVADPEAAPDLKLVAADTPSTAGKAGKGKAAPKKPTKAQAAAKKAQEAAGAKKGKAQKA